MSESIGSVDLRFIRHDPQQTPDIVKLINLIKEWCDANNCSVQTINTAFMD
jgi:hypothetical protein